IGIYELDQHFSPILKAKAIEMLSQHLDSDVEIQDLHASIFQLRIDGSGIAIRHHGRTDVPPLIVVKKFYADANVWDILAQRWNVHKVRIEGLEINIPPKEKREHKSSSGSKPDIPVHIDLLESVDAKLTLIPGDPDKLPHVFEIHRLTMK